MLDQARLLHFDVSIPGRSHKHIGYYEQTDGVKCFHFRVFYFGNYIRIDLGVKNLAITSQLAQKTQKNEQPNKVAHFHYIKFRFKYCSIVSLMIVFIFFSCSVTIRPFSIASWTITSVSPFC